MTPLTISELRLRQAQWSQKAEKLRHEWRGTTAVSPRALALGKATKAAQDQADDWAYLVVCAEGVVRRMGE